jgi:hypothetical protein
MDETIARAINSINQELEDLEDRGGVNDMILINPALEDLEGRGGVNVIKSKLIEISNLLNRLRESNSPSNDWTRLFCRQLARLMDYNESLSVNFWLKLYNEILYVIDGSQNEHGMVSDWNYFLKRMYLENELERRELQFQQTFGKRKSLNELFCEHKEFFEEYLHKCISLHSADKIANVSKKKSDVLGYRSIVHIDHWKIFTTNYLTKIVRIERSITISVIFYHLSNNNLTVVITLRYLNKYGRLKRH